jgi:hypothetical protein
MTTLHLVIVCVAALAALAIAAFVALKLSRDASARHARAPDVRHLQRQNEVLSAIGGALDTLRAHHALAPPAPSLVGETVAVVTKDDQTVRGIVAAEHADRVVLTGAVYYGKGGNTPAGHPVQVFHANRSSLQHIQPKAEDS